MSGSLDSEMPPVTARDLDSELYRRIVSEDEDERMPLDGGSLTAEQAALVRKWIEDGAVFDGPDADAPLATLLVGRKHPEPPSCWTSPTVPTDSC